MQVQELLALCFGCGRIRFRHRVATDGTADGANGVADELDQWCEEAAMTLALSYHPAVIGRGASDVQARAASCEYSVGQQGHGERVHAMRECCDASDERWREGARVGSRVSERWSGGVVWRSGLV